MMEETIRIQVAHFDSSGAGDRYRRAGECDRRVVPVGGGMTRLDFMMSSSIISGARATL
jgi:hypothetical protein